MGGSVALAQRPTLQLRAADSSDGALELVERVSAFREGFCRGPDSGDSDTSKLGQFQEEATLLESQIIERSDSTQQQQHVTGQRQSATDSGGPPEWVVKGIAYALQRALGLQLFNFDLLEPTSSEENALVYHVVDINYFPGYEKLPGHTERFIRFLAAVLSGEGRDGRLGPESFCSCVQMSSET